VCTQGDAQMHKHRRTCVQVCVRVPLYETWRHCSGQQKTLASACWLGSPIGSSTDPSTSPATNTTSGVLDMACERREKRRLEAERPMLTLQTMGLWGPMVIASWEIRRGWWWWWGAGGKQRKLGSGQRSGQQRGQARQGRPVRRVS
jgi:hypothetical protein